MLFAEIDDLELGVERVHFHLVDGRVDLGFGVEELFQLVPSSAPRLLFPFCPSMMTAVKTHMLDPVVAHAPHPHLTALNRILDCSPALQPGLLSAVRTV